MNKPVVALLICFTFLGSPKSGLAQTKTTNATGTGFSGPNISSVAFEAHSTEALQAMRSRAEDLKIGGVAVIAYFRGDRISSWTSKMLVVGRLKDNPTQTDKGANLLGIAYAKAAEMADTLKDSGKAGRPPMTGEFGWEGGVIKRLKEGYVIVAFSGGKSEDDISVSRSGAAKLVDQIDVAK